MQAIRIGNMVIDWERVYAFRFGHIIEGSQQMSEIAIFYDGTDTVPGKPFKTLTFANESEIIQQLYSRIRKESSRFVIVDDFVYDREKLYQADIDYERKTGSITFRFDEERISTLSLDWITARGVLASIPSV
jgi:hypothetical protein